MNRCHCNHGDMAHQPGRCMGRYIVTTHGGTAACNCTEFREMNDEEASLAASLESLMRN